MDHNVQIRAMKTSDVVSVVHIHTEQFPNARSTQLGKPFIKKMYTWFVEKQPQLALVATVDDEIVGFVVGAIGGYGRKIFRYALIEILLGLVIHPKMIFSQKTYGLWYSFLLGLLPWKTREPKNIHPTNATIVRASLSSIAVEKSAQGNGIGKKLLDAFEKQAKSLTAKRLSLTVESENTAAVRLYEKCGWKIETTDETRGSIHFIKEL